MSVKRSGNFLSQQRLDVSHIRSIESSVRSDFDDLMTSFVLGEDKSYVLRGFEINMTSAIGGAANGLEVKVANSSVLHGNSSQSGTFFVIPSGTDNEILNSTSNTRVDGAFTPSSLNYIGIEYTRAPDNATIDTVHFWNQTDKNEFSKTVPLALILDYKFVITNSLFDSNVLPIAVVETNANNSVISVEDRRPMYLRLGTAGSNTPDPFYKYPWVDGRNENPYTSTSTLSPFEGGDKQIGTLKDLLDAFMTEFLDLKGTTYWYSDSSYGSIRNLRGDLDRLQMTGSGSISHSSLTPGQMNWDSDIFLNFVGSRLEYKILANTSSTDIILSDNQAMYVNLVRNVDITPNLIFTTGSDTVTSVGAVSWTNDVQVNDFIKIKVADDSKYYKILNIDSASQVTLSENYLEASTGTSGLESQYAYGTYYSDPTPSTDRHLRVVDKKDVPFEQDIYWVFLRTDSSGSVAKVYMRGASGGEIEQGESRQISDNTTQEILSYIGSPSEVDITPDYTNSIATYLAEITTLSFGPASGITSGESFNLNSASNQNEYYVWVNKAGAGGDPVIPGKTGLELVLTGTENAIQVGTAFHSLVDPIGYFNSTDNLDGSVTIENSQVGETNDATNNDLAGLSISIDQDGVGKANCVVIDDENLTKSIKRLDEKICDILGADDEIYREKVSVITGIPVDTYEVQGPIVIGTTLTIPLNSRDNNVLPQYKVGSGVLEVFMNGHLLRDGFDYNEIGALDSLSSTIEILTPLYVGYELEYRFREGGTDGGGATADVSGVNLGPVSNANVFKQTVGTQLQFRRLTAGPGVVINEGPEDVSFSVTPSVAPKTVIDVNTDYIVQSVDDVVLVSNAGNDVTITLPSATASGREISIKKVDVGNTMFIKTIGGQLLDGVDADATPLGIIIHNESVTVISNGTSWFII